MEALSINTGAKSSLAISFLVLAILVPLLSYLFSIPTFAKNAPKQATEQLPIIGALKFFTQRYSWFHRQISNSRTGAFSFHVGNKPVVGLSGEQGRKLFFESKQLSFGPGWAGMMVGIPTSLNSENPSSDDNPEDLTDYDEYFTKRMVSLLKGPILDRGLPRMIEDVCGRLDELVEQDKHITRPFDSIYNIVFVLTMRAVGCNEIARDKTLLRRTLKYYEIIEKAASPWMIMYSWLPTIGKLMRTYGGARLYIIFNKIIEERKKTGREEGDALEFLMEQGDDVQKVITFVIGALFAGQLNSGINAAYILCCLANNKEWYNRVLDEVTSVANRHNADESLSLKEKLRSLPLAVWEKEFPMIDYCLKDSIRINQIGTAFRMNLTGRDISIGNNESIPNNAYVALHFAETALDSNIYSDPEHWDASRYLPERAEDKKALYAWTGWGAGRHPCLGMRFAKLEINIIIAFFFAYFEDFSTVDSNGQTVLPPPIQRERHVAGKPKDDIWLQYKVRKD